VIRNSFDIEEGRRMQKEKRCFEAIPNRYGMHTGMNLNGCRCGNSKAARLPKLRGSSHCRFRHLTISERGGAQAGVMTSRFQEFDCATHKSH